MHILKECIDVLKSLYLENAAEGVCFMHNINILCIFFFEAGETRYPGGASC